MTNNNSSFTLSEIAHQAMLDKDFIPNFSSQVIDQLRTIQNSQLEVNKDSILDLRHKLWFSIDNDDSRDLDQLTYTEKNPEGLDKIFIAIADVDALVKKETPIDNHAQRNTTSVYTPSIIFPMLPEKLSTDLTSLNENESRLAIVVEVEIHENGSFGAFNVYQAWVKNHAKLAYSSIGRWLENSSYPVAKVTAIPELAEQLQRQDYLAQKIKLYRQSQGMLSFERTEAKPVVREQQVVALDEIKTNRARELIEFFMICANNATTKFLRLHNFPIFRRVVRIPKRWNRIVELVKEFGTKLPDEPDPIALEKFLVTQKQSNPSHFSDLSLSLIKLIGKGEYAVQLPGEEPLIHFGLSLREYSHSTAPNRRFPDLIAQRLIKDVLNQTPLSYSNEELKELASHCTQKENDAEKVQRRLDKAAAAMLLSSHIGDEFDAIVTGASSKGTFVRITHPPIEGKLVSGFQDVDVGCRFKVKLMSVDVFNGYIDFARISPPICI